MGECRSLVGVGVQDVIFSGLVHECHLFCILLQRLWARMVELVDTRDLKSLSQEWLYGFESRFEHLRL